MPNDRPTRRFRLRFSLKQLLLAVAVVGVGLGIWNWMFRREVVVRAATPEDAAPANAQSRNVAVATGRFRKGMWLFVRLDEVRNGLIELIDYHQVGRAEATQENPTWENIDLRFVFDESGFRDGGRVDGLVIEGVFQDDIVNGHLDRRVGSYKLNVVATKTLPGTITPGRPHIVYVEGDRQIVVDGKMTVEEFAKANPGNYLVVTVEVK
jgi:hypothetical protein